MVTRTMKQIGLGIGAVVLGLSAVAAVSAQGQGSGQPPFAGRRGGPGGPGGPMGTMGIPLNRLDLTDAQREQVKSIMESHQTELRTLGEKAMTVRRALDKAVTADTVDEGAIRARAADLAVVESDMAVARARVHADVLQILTSEQKAKLKELQAERETRGGPPRQPRH